MGSTFNFGEKNILMDDIINLRDGHSFLQDRTNELLGKIIIRFQNYDL